jgi:hypothetical protein
VGWEDEVTRVRAKSDWRESKWRRNSLRRLVKIIEVVNKVRGSKRE